MTSKRVDKIIKHVLAEVADRMSKKMNITFFQAYSLIESVPDYINCSHVITKGRRMGEVCNNTLCPHHEDPRIEKVTHLVERLKHSRFKHAMTTPYTERGLNKAKKLAKNSVRSFLSSSDEPNLQKKEKKKRLKKSNPKYYENVVRNALFGTMDQSMDSKRTEKKEQDIKQDEPDETDSDHLIAQALHEKLNGQSVKLFM